MLRRWILLVCASLTALAVLAGCTLDPGLRAVQGDPMASWTPSGMVSEDRYEQGASQEFGFSSTPHLTRTIHMTSAEAAKAAAGQAMDAAKSFGWKEIPNSIFLGKQLDGGLSADLSADVSDVDPTNLVIRLSAS